jgi:hypothetical protein
MSTLFFKSPSQITMAEMCGDLPSMDSIFEASSPTEYSQIAQMATGPPFSRPSLKELIALLLDENWKGAESTEWATMGSEHLILVIFGKVVVITYLVLLADEAIALHSVVFLSRTGLLLQSTHQIFFRATSRWKELWEHVHTRDKMGEMRPIGFVKYGLELWWLVRKILDAAQADDLQSQYLSNGPTDSLKELHDFIRQNMEK